MNATRTVIMAAVLIIAMVMAGTAVAGIVEDWPMGAPNTYDGHGQYVMIDFEENVSSFDPIVCTIPGITFVTTGGNQWVYACMDGRLNMRNETSGSGSYVVNGYAGAWCGVDGDGGRVTFDNPVRHVSCLVSSYSGLIMVAYDSNDNEVTNSSWATSNGGTHNFTMISVDRDERDISYVIIHDDGNQWLVDDLIVGGLNVHRQNEMAHCQKFIHSQGQDHWNDSAWMNKTHPCNYTV